MKWLELHIDTARAGLEPVSELLREQGVEGLVIDDEADFKDFLENNHQYWDYVDDELLAEKHGKCRVTFYLEESESGFSTLAQVRIALSALKKQHPEYAPLLLTMENVEDATGRTTGSSSISPWRSASACWSFPSGSRRSRRSA